MKFEPKVQTILGRLTSYLRDVQLADKCGLSVQDICEHESDGKRYMTFGPYHWPAKYCCKKCGAWKEEM